MTKGLLMKGRKEGEGRRKEEWDGDKGGTEVNEMEVMGEGEWIRILWGTEGNGKGRGRRRKKDNK